MASKILIAEDNEHIAEVYKKLLEHKGHNITVTYDGQECIDAYKNEIKAARNLFVNPYDVVLVDFAMPKKS
jgi:CheY-like chemotaxis protein